MQTAVASTRRNLRNLPRSDEEQAKSDKRGRDAFAAGRTAAESDWSIGNCPHTIATVEWREWRRGYQAVVDEALRGIARHKKEA